jgi:hypothetical protein
MSNQSFADEPRFSIGRVLSTAFAVLMRNFLPFVTVAIIIGIPLILLSYWEGQNPPAPQAAVASGARIGQFGIGLLIALLVSAVTQSALTYGALQDLRGQRIGFVACIAGGFAVLPGVVPVAILLSLAVLCGSVLLIVPGFILAVIWWVAIPVAVVERAGVAQSFGRSLALTAGKRWQIFGLLLIILAIQVAIGFLIAVIIGFVAGFIAAVGHMQLLNLRWLGSTAQVAAGTFTAVTTAVGYYYLRAEKEGVAIGDIAKVFD